MKRIAKSLIWIIPLFSLPPAFSKGKKSMPLPPNSIQIGAETLSLKREAERTDLDVKAASVNLALIKPFRLKLKAWQADDQKKQFAPAERDLGSQELEQIRGGFLGVEMTNDIKFLRFNFAMGFQETRLEKERVRDFGDNRVIDETSYRDSGPAFIASVEAHMSQMILALNVGANHRTYKDRTDAFGGLALGFAY